MREHVQRLGGAQEREVMPTLQLEVNPVGDRQRLAERMEEGALAQGR